MCKTRFVTLSEKVNLCVQRGRVLKALDPRSRATGFDSCSAGHACILGQALIYIASVQPAVMGTRWNENWYCGNVGLFPSTKSRNSLLIVVLPKELHKRVCFICLVS